MAIKRERRLRPLCKSPKARVQRRPGRGPNLAVQDMHGDAPPRAGPNQALGGAFQLKDEVLVRGEHDMKGFIRFCHGCQRFLSPFAEKTTAGFPKALADFPQLVYPTGNGYLRRVRAKRWLAYAKWLVRPIAWRILPRPLALWLSRMTNR